MDLFDTDKKICDLSDTQIEDFLENDMFTPPPSTDAPMMKFSLENVLDNDLDSGMETEMASDWLDTFFDDPVLNDRMISDALQPQPHVQSEHSYSLANNDNALDMTIKKEHDKDLETEMLTKTMNPNNMTPTSLIVSQSNTTQTSLLSNTSVTSAAANNTTQRIITQQQQPSPPFTSIVTANNIKREPVDPETTMVTVTRTTNPHTLLKPTIILATQSTMHQQQQQFSISNIKQERLVLPKSQPVTSAVSVKVEPAYSVTSSTSSSALSPDISYDALSLPPTPPSSNTSDSEGCQSPERSLPASPVRQSLYTSRTAYRATPSPPPYSHANSQPFFMHPIPSSGMLVLSEEEKRTLITEGYPVPAKLPLSKTEEKNLKKIRRKIKNKISAQESRRKKKEYLESLERKVESFCQENVDLKKKVDNLENSNRSLMSQLHKLQTLVGKVRPQNASVTGSCLMVLVLCFAMFLGSWSPASLSVGYSSISGSVPPATLPNHGPPDAFTTTLGGLVVDTVMAPGVAPQGPGIGPMAGMADSSIGDYGGYGVAEGTKNAEPSSFPPSASQPIGPASHQGHEVTADPYATPNMKSRVLLSLEEEEEAVYGPSTPFCLHSMLTRWFSVGLLTSGSAKPVMAATSGDTGSEPVLPKIDTLDVEMEINQTGSDNNEGHFKVAMAAAAAVTTHGEEQAIMHPDIAVMTPPRKQVNATA